MIQIRNSCFETNSSSSHSVCISMDSEIDPSIYELIKNDKLYIYPRDNGFSNLKTNKCLDKLQFLVSLRGSDVSTVQGSKRIKYLRTLLKQVIGVGSVYLGHIDDYYDILRQTRDKKLFENSWDYTFFLRENFTLPRVMNIDQRIEEEIFESRETLRSFILSPNSWLYSYRNSYRRSLDTINLSLDENDVLKFECEKYYYNKQDTDSIISIEYLPGLRVDIEANIMREDGNLSLEDIINSYSCDSEFNLINRINILDNKLNIVEKGEFDEKLIRTINGKYYLIHLFFKKGINNENKSILRKIKPNHKFEGCPSYVESYKIYPISIKSNKFLGDLIL